MHEFKLFEVGSHLILSHVFAVGESWLEDTPAFNEPMRCSDFFERDLQLCRCSLDELLVAFYYSNVVSPDFDNNFFIQIIQFWFGSYIWMAKVFGFNSGYESDGYFYTNCFSNYYRVFSIYFVNGTFLCKNNLFRPVYILLGDLQACRIKSLIYLNGRKFIGSRNICSW